MLASFPLKALWSWVRVHLVLYYGNEFSVLSLHSFCIRKAGFTQCAGRLRERFAKNCLGSHHLGAWYKGQDINVILQVGNALNAEVEVLILLQAAVTTGAFLLRKA